MLSADYCLTAHLHICLLMHSETKPFSSLVEKVENEGSKITFTDDAVAYIKSHADSGEKVHREILLRDPIVRSFINIKDDRR